MSIIHILDAVCDIGSHRYDDIYISHYKCTTVRHSFPRQMKRIISIRICVCFYSVNISVNISVNGGTIMAAGALGQAFPQHEFRKFLTKEAIYTDGHVLLHNKKYKNKDGKVSHMFYCRLKVLYCNVCTLLFYIVLVLYRVPMAAKSPPRQSILRT